MSTPMCLPLQQQTGPFTEVLTRSFPDVRSTGPTLIRIEPDVFAPEVYIDTEIIYEVLRPDLVAVARPFAPSRSRLRTQSESS
jgi:hypothetical protein